MLGLNIAVGKHPTFTIAALTALINFIPYFSAFLIGCIAVPVLLPWIPFRSFALKGLLVGFIPVVSSFLSLNFTGSTTYTSLSGVKKEMKFALTSYIAAVALGLILIAADSIIKLLY